MNPGLCKYCQHLCSKLSRISFLPAFIYVDASIDHAHEKIMSLGCSASGWAKTLIRKSIVLSIDLAMFGKGLWFEDWREIGVRSYLFCNHAAILQVTRNSQILSVKVLCWYMWSFCLDQRNGLRQNAYLCNLSLFSTNPIKTKNKLILCVSKPRKVCYTYVPLQCYLRFYNTTHTQKQLNNETSYVKIHT